MFSTISSLIAHILTHPLLDPATKNLPFGEKLKTEMSNNEANSAAMSPVPIS